MIGMYSCTCIHVYVINSHMTLIGVHELYNMANAPGSPQPCNYIVHVVCLPMACIE